MGRVGGRLKELGYIMRRNITKNKNKSNQYEKLDRTKQKSEDDSAMFCNNIYNDIKELYIFVGKLLSTHATVCKFNTAGIKRSRAKRPAARRGV